MAGPSTIGHATNNRAVGCPLFSGARQAFSKTCRTGKPGTSPPVSTLTDQVDNSAIRTFDLCPSGRILIQFCIDDVLHRFHVTGERLHIARFPILTLILDSLVAEERHESR
jgi:hypothetical protein